MEEKDRGLLYLVPTPIGNLDDITYRALKILEEVDIIAAEDTRHTGQLLHYFNIQKKLLSYHEHNKEEMGARLRTLLLEGNTIALCSDAGMPAISDPGNDLVKQCIHEGIKVVPLPGANAALTALIASGLDTSMFTFIGFLPKRKKNRKERLETIKYYEGTLLFYEAPHRLKEVLTDMLAIFGNRKIVIGRELTKQFETFTRTTLEEVVTHLEMLVLKGEFVLLLEGASKVVAPLTKTPVEAVETLLLEGIDKKVAIKQIAIEYNIPKREVYNAILNRKE